MVVAAFLVDFSYHCADTGTCGSPDESSLEAAAEDRAEQSTAACADEGAFAGANAALLLMTIVVVAVVVVVVVSVVVVAVVIVVAVVVVAVVAIVVIAVAAVLAATAHSVIEVGILISILGAGSHRQEACGQHERGDEYSFSYLHHLELDASLVGRGQIFSRAAPISPLGEPSPSY